MRPFSPEGVHYSSRFSSYSRRKVNEDELVPLFVAAIVKWDAAHVEREFAAVGVPLVGEHSQDILHEMGYSDEEIRALATDGAIRLASPPARISPPA